MQRSQLLHNNVKRHCIFSLWKLSGFSSVPCTTRSSFTKTIVKQTAYAYLRFLSKALFPASYLARNKSKINLVIPRRTDRLTIRVLSDLGFVCHQ
jgi:hypothetical protein